MSGKHDDEGLAKRIVHKIQGKHHKDEVKDDTEELKPDKPLHDSPDPHPRHSKVEGYVESGVHAAFIEILDSLNQPEVLQTISKLVKAQAEVGVQSAINEGLSSLGSEKGMEVVGRLVASQAIILAKAAVDPVGRIAAREGAMEAVTGSYDAVEKKYLEWYVKNKLTVQLGGLAIAALLLPLVISLWRFAIFGFGSSSCR
ncbi:hypothetical protein COCOBI_10-0530 [Coccomyxa sp. Obi]|nr:hypothetical protein COCOBI_10-0530 [Coccomyxa sp. Obi]